MAALSIPFVRRLFALASVVYTARAQLIQQVWPSLAFAPQASSVTTRASALDFAGDASAFPALASVRFTGTLVDVTADELLTFSALVDGGVRLWLDDHLVLDAGGNRTSPGTPVRAVGFLGVPFTRGIPRALRLEYSRWGGVGSAPSTLQLSWSGNVTALAVVPASAFAPVVSPFLVERDALRDRLEVPSVPWQTYSMTSMGAHVLMPAGLALAATLGIGNTTLGRIVVFRNGNPVLVRPGLRSVNGSDYTLLTLSQWQEAPAAIVAFETTVTSRGDLVFLATCTAACAGLRLHVQPLLMAERAGVLSAGTDGRTLLADLPGFGTVVATALNATKSVPCSSSGAGAQPCFALDLSSGVAGYWTGAGPPPSVPAAQAAIASAAAAALASEAPFGELAPLWEGLASALAWNSVFTPYEGVITPVSHVMGDVWGQGFLLFEWDSFFLALMAAVTGGRAKDLAYATLIQVTLGRTLMGFVPNGAAGPRRSYDRSENQVGALVLKAIVDKWGDTWLLDGLLPVMLSWNDWVWARRRGEGVLAGEDGFADLMCLGSDPNSPASDTQDNMQAARYEGMDNSPIYDAPPASFNRSTHHLDVYDVGASALFASDTEATIALCATAAAAQRCTDCCSQSTPTLQERLTRVQAAMNAHLWDADAGLYGNVLFNGTKLARYAPTSVFPMLSGTPSDAQAAGLVSLLAAPTGFCYNLSHTPAPASDMLVQWYSPRTSRRAACVSPACTRDAIAAGLHNERIEAVVLLPSGGPADGLAALSTYVNTATGDTALMTGAPPAGFALVRLEGWCWDSPPSGWPTTNLTLWLSSSRGVYMTCGTAECEAAAPPDYVFVRTMCAAYNATGPENCPCKVGGPSITRGDDAFMDQAYWRGRAWGPQHMLIYWALARYDHLPAARAVRSDLVTMGAQLQLANWADGVVCENAHGITGTCEDSTNADPFYTWGALWGFPSLVESGFYKPIKVAAGPGAAATQEGAVSRAAA